MLLRWEQRELAEASGIFPAKRLRVLGLGDEATFSPFGVDNLAEFVQIHKADPSAPP
jgi:hypothetical protein